MRNSHTPGTTAARPQIDAILLIAFVVIVFLLGGGSRADTSSLMILRPLAALFLTTALVRTPCLPSGYRVPVAFGLTLTTFVALQLVPLPPSVWTILPGREPLLDVARAAGIAPGWKPLSMQPVRTWNALFSLMIPMAALMLCASAGHRVHRRLLPVLVGLGACSAVLGLLQVIGPETGPLYLYRGTGDGFANGLFANRNHHATMIACLFPMLAALARRQGRDPGRAEALRWMLAAFAVFLVAVLLLTGSRAGLALGIFGMIGAIWLYLSDTPRTLRRQYPLWRRYLPVLTAIGIILILVAVSVVAARSPSISRLFGEGLEGGRRLAVYPTVIAMIPTYFPVGAGFGTFAEIFQISEPDAILGPTYLNQAHNDWLQILIEGGAPAILLAVGAIVAVIRLALSVSAGGSEIPSSLGRAGIVILVIIALASIVDYPARTPSIMVLAVIALVWMIAAVRDRDASHREQG